MADKQKLTKGKRAVPYSKKKAPAKKTANEEPADEQYVEIDHYDYTEKDWKVVPRPGREKGRRETVVPQPSASALPSEVPEEEEEVVEEGEIVPGVEGTDTIPLWMSYWIAWRQIPGSHAPFILPKEWKNASLKKKLVRTCSFVVACLLAPCFVPPKTTKSITICVVPKVTIGLRWTV